MTRYPLRNQHGHRGLGGGVRLGTTPRRAPTAPDAPAGRANALDYLGGGGRHVTAEATIAWEILVLGVPAGSCRAMHEAWLGMVLAKVRGSGLGTSFTRPTPPP